MNRKRIKLLGLFFLATIVFGLIGLLPGRNPASNVGQSFNLPHLALSQASTLTNRTAQLYLNGIWQFAPANNPKQLPVATHWGSIWVPGDWKEENNELIPGLISRGKGPEWENFNGKTLSRAWYQQTVEIPPDWQGRTILLDLGRVSTDAIIYANGINCGQIDWPYGTVDITKAVGSGSNTLSILVAAVADEQQKAVIMGPTEIYTIQADLYSRGIIGEVRLLSIPPGPQISDVFVQPSTRNQQITLDIELKDVTQAGPVEIVAQMLDEKGNVEQQFAASATLKAQQIQTLETRWNWSNPRLWDIDRPNLYTLRLNIKGKGIDTQYNQPFGFREFWVEGRKFYLNGQEFRLRPGLLAETWENGIPQVADRIIDGYSQAGYNIVEIWPWNHDERGRWHFRELLTERADLKGFPVMAPALDVTALTWSNKWFNPWTRNHWKQAMAVDLRRYRNHPSVLMWTTSPNYFGNGDDQNPWRIGKRKVVGTLGSTEDKRLREKTPIAEEAFSTIKAQDSTRPIMVHQGGNFGDVYSLNSYLNLIPLQEREEWLTEWQKNGEMPYMAVEFGTPLHTTMMRNRTGFDKAIASEPFMTEYTAIYLGKEAYELETEAYKEKIRQQFLGNQKYKSWHYNQELDFAPAFQKLQALFTTNTWRSWRTLGMTGGMVPWHNGHGWDVSEAGRTKVALGSFQPGHRGVYLKQVSKSQWDYLKPEGYKIYPGGEALLKNNGPTLAWIAGPAAMLTAKDRSFAEGEKLEKQVAIINDQRTQQNFSFQWQVNVGGQSVGLGQKQGNIDPATTLFFPIVVHLPTKVSQKLEGEIRLTASIGDRKHEDRFQFRVFPQQTKASGTIAIFDPVGKTSTMLQQLGYQVKPWNGSNVGATSGELPILAIGREALSSGQPLPGNLETFVDNGGRLLIFSQKREWLSQVGFRIAEHVSRRVFPIENNSPLMKGLDAADLQDWRGQSTLIAAYPDTRQKGARLSPKDMPWYGWHWGNQGAVSSASVEKPHRSGWRPILESEFDLAYSPLMELNYGKGLIVLNELDLEDRVPQDVVAVKLAQEIVTYTMGSPLSPRIDRAVLIGNDADAAKLNNLGIIYQKESALLPHAKLAIIGSEVTVKDEELRKYLQGGGKAFFLPRKLGSAALGVMLKEVENFGGSLKVPNWPEARGLSASDLRARSFYDPWLIESGGEVAANGLLSRIQIGSGVAIFSQIDPDSLDADRQTYFRMTRWRQTRANAQILANLGARFETDRAIFSAQNPSKLYHPDYRTDFEWGDDPYRYYRW